ncbi:MAG: hypothetical protein J5819_00405 [Eubacterium sp.]|nr:hypothetical protein [Eubacterium sp.]
MTIDLSFLSGLGVDAATGRSYTGGQEKYISALQRFFKSYEKNKKNADAFYEKKDYENYMITVHSLKSNSKMIGAEELSGRFEQLEIAARDGDTVTIDREHARTMELYAKLIDGLRPIGEAETVKPADEISGDEARDVAEQLLAALDDFDDDLSAELVKKLSGYPFRLTQREKLKSATEYIGDFMYDEAAGLIREIVGAIE